MVAAWLVLLAAAGCSGGGPAGPGSDSEPVFTASDTVRIGVGADSTFQAIDGFGGTQLSLVWSGTDYLGTLRPATLTAAFTAVGLRRAMLAVGVTEAPAAAANPVDQRRNDDNDPFNLNVTGFNFTAVAAMRSAVLVPGAADGFASTELGPLLDLRSSLDWLKAVRAASYQRYLDESAESVLAVLQQYRSAYGVTPPLVHLFNEPTSGNTELFTTSVQEVVDLVRTIGLRLRTAGFSETRFVVPNEETMERSLQVSRAILADPVARPFVGAIGFHQYPYGSVSSSPRRLLATSGAGTPDAATRASLEDLRQLGAQYGVPLWMTEVSEGPGTTDFATDAIEYVLARSLHIHDVLRYGGASAYFGMHTMWDSRTHAEHFAGRSIPLSSETSSIVLVNLDTRAVMITGMGYAIGHYARWLGPRATRVATTSSAARTPALAFRDVSRNRVVLVATNTEAFARLLQVRVGGATAAGPVTGEYSAGTRRWIPLTATVNAGGVVEYVAPPRSVVSLAIPLR